MRTRFDSRKCPNTPKTNWPRPRGYSLRLGIRTVEVQGGQILLNGKPVKLNGFGRHEDFFASGKGLNLPLLVKDYALMGWTGANAHITCDPNPQLTAGQSYQASVTLQGTGDVYLDFWNGQSDLVGASLPLSSTIRP